MAGYYQNLIESLIPYSVPNELVRLLASETGLQIDDFFAAWEDTVNQLFVATATWELSRYETLLDLPSNTTLPHDVRRSRILARLRSSIGIRPDDMRDALEMLGYPDAVIEELFATATPLPIYNGDVTHSQRMRTGFKWALFKLRFQLAEYRNWLQQDRDDLVNLVEEIKPAHMGLAGIGLILPFEDHIPELAESAHLTTDISYSDPFIRAGFRHNSQVVFGTVLQHNRRFLHGGQSLYNRLIPGVVNRHFCIDEAADTTAVLSILDKPEVFAPHQGWARNNLKYSGAIAQGRATADALVKLDDVSQENEEAAIVKPVIRFADAYIERQPHGIAVHPTRKGELFYSGAWLHEKRRPRSGSLVYGDHPARYAGPRRDGRHRYGILPGDRVDVYATRVSMIDQPMAIFNDRAGHAFYRDRIPHGSGRMAVDVNANKLGLNQSDVFALPGDSLPGIDMDLSINDRAALTYSWAHQVPHNGGYIHGQAPFNLVKAASTLVLSDNCKGRSSYGGLEVPALHDGGGLRWRHQGNLLRLPFARHEAQWPRDGCKRYLEARARYSDLATMHDGMERYGRQRVLHDGGQTRTPGSMPENMTITVRRGYRRIAV